MLLLPCTYKPKQEGSYTLEVWSRDAHVSLRPITDANIPKATEKKGAAKPKRKAGGRAQARSPAGGRNVKPAAEDADVSAMTAGHFSRAGKGMKALGDMYAGMDL